MLKKLFCRLVSILLTTAFLCGIFSGCSREKDDGTGYLFTCTIPGNPGCIDPQYTENQNAQIVIETIMEGLLRLDETGAVVPAGAESYQISDDGLLYEFKLRNDCTWISAGTEEKDAKPVTSLDYVFAFQRLLNPETHAPHAEEYLCLKNAGAILNGQEKPEKLGVSAPDGGTVIFQLEYPEADFLYLLTQNCAVPCNQDFFLSTNGRYGLDDQTILCNGAFCLTKWAYDDYGSGNFLTFRKNTLYHDAGTISPSNLQFTIMRSRKEADEDFAQGNSDCILTNTYPAKYLNSKNYTVRNSCTKTIGLIFNPDDEILKNQKLRQALAYGIDRNGYADRLSGNLQPASGLIPPAVQFLGRSYRELYADEPLVLPYAPEEAMQCFDEAFQSVTANEISNLKILIPDSFSDTQAVLSICQEWQDLSGRYIGIELVSPSEYQSRLDSGDYTIALYIFETPRNSCYASLQSFLSNAETFGFDSKNADMLLNALSGESQLSDQVALYGQTEKAILETNCFLPLFYQNLYLIYTSDNTDIFPKPFTNSIDFRKAKHFK
ncbi:MAG: peptide ABC transporter substrate-binding protein [Oscillospiraceae bacterium]|nr:peptide ABC transporter substrate-binding protein [Oscillospiraceae bacterium]